MQWQQLASCVAQHQLGMYECSMCVSTFWGFLGMLLKPAACVCLRAEIANRPRAHLEHTERATISLSGPAAETVSELRKSQHPTHA